MPIKTFKGLIADGAQDTIVLHTSDGSTGYRIVKFQIMPENGADHKQESTVKIYKVEQTSQVSLVDFSDQTLLAAAYLENNDSAADMGGLMTTIFEREIFNQDIYITHKDDGGETRNINYYLELEQVKLDLSESTVATLKDIRNETQP